VLSVAEGRIWSGSEAVGIGLVDANGGLYEAIAKAANLADLASDYQLKELRLPVSPFEAWLQGMGMVAAKSLGINYNMYGDEIDSFVKENIDIFTNSGMLMITPQTIEVNF
jgi:protease-4